MTRQPALPRRTIPVLATRVHGPIGGVRVGTVHGGPPYLNEYADPELVPFSTLRYRKDGAGVVYVQGRAERDWRAGPPNGAAIFRLPLGYRPLYDELFGFYLSEFARLGYVVIRADGFVRPYVASDSSEWPYVPKANPLRIPLPGIRWRVA